jgi:hypothetical protein
VVGSVDSGVVDVGRLLEHGAGSRNVDGGVVEVDALLVAGPEAGAVNGAAYLDFVTVVGLEAGAVCTFSNVDGGVVRAVGLVDLNA